ncbi:MAG TPA: ricin-type beta-trefoil lectin domain protein [Actinocrinis sp.]|uniref:RICIN domain-containing protein n=1 Tax=Actinocrinis sp. TaxID=1920516 RepID=UPI002DDCD1E8|nr:ricin-type beta-trefoil lectin domain protein [Actinocrinis sp.]HEV2348070.1 ricin-type beta-trefoil lectin domain protein [Actinocrinis sp.]
MNMIGLPKDSATVGSADHGRGARARRGASLALAGGMLAAAVVAATGSAWASATPGASPTATQRMASLNPGTGVSPNAITAADISICTKVAAKAGFSFNRTVGTVLGQEPQIVVAVSIAMAESSCNPSATNINTNGSEDRGLWQINNAAWPNVSDACAFQVQCNADAAWNISNHGTNWGPWSTFNNGAWENYVGSARSALSSFTFQLKDQGSNTCLDADGTNIGNGGKIFQWTCNAGDNFQQWTVEYNVGSLPILRNVGSGTCLDADGSSKGNGSPIFQWACNHSDGSQEWWFNGSGKLNTNGNAEAGLQNNNDGTCLDADGTNIGNGGKIFQWTCNGSDSFQLWN